MNEVNKIFPNYATAMAKAIEKSSEVMSFDFSSMLAESSRLRKKLRRFRLFLFTFYVKILYMNVKIYSFDKKEENEILRKVSEEVKKNEFKTQKLKKIIDDMFEFIIKQPDGAGLSAPQIGINKRIFVINPKMFDYDKNGETVPKNKKNEDCVYINPKIIKVSNKKQEIEEGCFSVR